MGLTGHILFNHKIEALVGESLYDFIMDGQQTQKTHSLGRIIQGIK